jgi:hypothetical protein
MRLLDKRRQVIVDVADNLVNDALTSGNYELRPGIRIPVTLPDGTVGDLDSEEMPKALQMGVRYRTSAEDREAAQAEIQAIRKEAADMPVTAAGLGALRGATLGLSDVAIRAGLGQETAEFAREVRDVSPTASIAGEIAGGVAGLAAPIAPVAAATAAGAKAASVIGRGAQQLTAVQKMGRALVGGTVEGAAIGAGQTVSEMALADPELTAQKAVANVGLGALFGGGLSVAGRGLLEGTKAATTSALTAAGKTEFVPKTIKDFTGWVTEKYGNLSAISRGDFDASLKGIEIDPRTKEIFARNNAEGRRTLVKYMNNPQQLTKEFSDSVTAGIEVADELERAASQTAKVQRGVLDAEIGKVDKAIFKRFDEDWSDEAELADDLGIEGILYRPALKGTKLEKAEKGARLKKFDAVDAEARRLIAKLDDVTAEMREGNQKFGGNVYDPGAIMVLDDARAELSKRIFDESRTITDVNDAIVAVKNQIAEQGKVFDRNPQFLSSADARAAEKLKNVWGELRRASTNEKLFGEFGAAVAKRADILTTIRRSVDNFNDLFFISRKNRQGKWERIPNDRAQDLFIRSAGNSANFKKQLALDDFKAGVREAAEQLEPLSIKGLDDEIARLEKLADQNSKRLVNQAQQAGKERAAKYLDDQIANMKAQRVAVDDFNKSVMETKQSALAKIDDIEKQIEGTIEMKVAAKLMQSLEISTGRSLMGMAQGLGLGSLVGGPAFAVPAMMIGGALQNPKTALKFLSGIETAADGFDRMAKNASEKFVRFDKKIGGVEGVIGKAVPAVRQTIIREKLRMEPTERPQDDETAFKAHRKKLTAMQQDPESLMLRVMDNLGEDAVASPRLLIETQTTVTRGLSFLESKIPKDPYNPGVYPDDFVPSPVEMSHYGDYVQAVMKPKVILRQMSDGNINHRTVEAIKAVYPKMYDDLLTQVTGQLMRPEKASFQARIQLGILFGVPSVKAMQPDYLARMAALKQPQQAQQPQNNGNMAALNSASREQRV